jgi:hypothetical protein
MHAVVGLKKKPIGSNAVTDGEGYSEKIKTYIPGFWMEYRVM